MPAAEKLAVVERAAALLKVTVPGPLVFVQRVVTGSPLRPSSVYEPFSVAAAGSVIV